VFGCTNGDGTTPDGSWYRLFSLADAGITNNFAIQQVTFGVCFAVGTPTAHVSLGSYAGGLNDTTLDLTKVTNIRKMDVSVPATQISKLVDVPLTAQITPDTKLLVEISTDDFNGTGQQLNIGLTAAAETHPPYLRSPLCGTATPTTTTAGGQNAHMVITVTGTR
jgi:hypothetical protein